MRRFTVSFPKIKVAFNGTCIQSGKSGGWPRYTETLLAEFHKKYSEEIELFVFQNQQNENHSYWEQVTLPALCEDAQIDVLHAPANGGLPLRGNFLKVLTIHDLFSEEDFSWSFALKGFSALKMALRYKMDWHLSLKVANQIITVSDFSKTQLEKAGHSQVHRIYEGGWRGAGTLPPDLAPPSRPFLLYVGSNDPRKRVAELVRWFQGSGLKMDLVLAGRGHSGFAQTISEQSEIRVQDEVSEDVLGALYVKSFLFITFSKAEGFGLPMVEAMQFGKPVLFTGGGSLPEVCGEGGLKLSEKDLASTIRRLHSDRADYSMLQKKAREQATQFNWGRCAEETLALYRKLLSSRVKSATTSE